MKKSERIDLRVTPEEKILFKQNAKENGMNISEYACYCIKKVSSQKSYEQQIKNSLTENHILNSLLLNPDLSNSSKQIIRKEIGKYV